MIYEETSIPTCEVLVQQHEQARQRSQGLTCQQHQEGGSQTWPWGTRRLTRSLRRDGHHCITAFPPFARWLEFWSHHCQKL